MTIQREAEDGGRWLKGLNAAQQAAVRHETGAALVLAGAGSGKTRVITQRAAYLLSQGYRPSELLLVTFTNKAAEEMRRRVGLLLGEERLASDLLCGTFHSIANGFLRRYGERLGYLRGYTILDEADARDLLRVAMAEVLPERGSGFPKPSEVQRFLSLAFNCHLPLATLAEQSEPEWLDSLEILQQMAMRYQRLKFSQNVMDFDDLLRHWHLLLRRHAAELPLARRLKQVMVDEYQDANHVQGQILELLAPPPKGALMVVGDDAQSIYSWRGADFVQMLEFPKRCEAPVYKLETNYRSTPRILTLANACLAQNERQFAKHLRPIREGGELPELHHVYSMEEEAEIVCRTIGEHLESGMRLRDIGVLYRNNAQSAYLQLALQAAGWPFVVRSGLKFFELAHVKDVIAFLRVLHNPLDALGWLRVLKMLPGVGDRTASKIIGHFREAQAVLLTPENSALHKLIPRRSQGRWRELCRTFHPLTNTSAPAARVRIVRDGFYQQYLREQYENGDERQQDLDMLVELASRYETTEAFLTHMSLEGGAILPDQEDTPQTDRLVLSTIHQAKGLEWAAVIVLGLSEGRFPNARSLEPPARLEEERRLLYVAITRAQRHLHLFAPMMVGQQGYLRYCGASRFVAEWDEALSRVIRHTSWDPFVDAPKATPTLEPVFLTEVSHDDWGDGGSSWGEDSTE